MKLLKAADPEKGKYFNIAKSVRFILPIIILCLDQSTKLIVNKNFTPHESMPIIKGIFHLTLVHNRGAAFGMLKGQTFLFVFTSIVAIILIYHGLKNTRGNLYSISLGLILAGAIGNLIDRVFFGYVIDFLDLRIWPVFNVADSAITVGTILLGWSILQRTDDREQNRYTRDERR